MIASKDGHPANVSQLDKFKQAARELECNDEDQAFKERLKRIAKADAVQKGGNPPREA